MLRWILLLALMLLIPMAHAAEQAKSSYRPYSDIPAEVRAKIRETPSLARIDVSTRTELKLNDIVKTDLLVINPNCILILGHPDAKYIILAAKKVVFQQPMSLGYFGDLISTTIEVAGGGSRMAVFSLSDAFGTSSLTVARPAPGSPRFYELAESSPATPPPLFLCFDTLEFPAGKDSGACFHIASRGADGARGGDIWLVGPNSVLHSPHEFKFFSQCTAYRHRRPKTSNPSGTEPPSMTFDGNIFRVKTD